MLSTILYNRPGALNRAQREGDLMALCFHHVRLAFCVGVLAACGSTSGPDPSTPNGVAGASNSAGTAGALAGQPASGGAASAAGGGGVAGGAMSGAGGSSGGG